MVVRKVGETGASRSKPHVTTEDNSKFREAQVWGRYRLQNLQVMLCCFGGVVRCNAMQQQAKQAQTGGGRYTGTTISPLLLAPGYIYIICNINVCVCGGGGGLTKSLM